MGVNNIAAGIFCVAWTLFLLGEVSKNGGNANPGCDASNPTDNDDTMCHGYSAAAVFDCFGAVCSLLAAGFVAQDATRNMLFLLSLFGYGIAQCAENGTWSRLSCLVSNTENECKGYGFSAAFYCFAALTALGTAVYAKLNVEKLNMVAAGYFVFLSLFGLGLTAQLATTSKEYCDSSSGNKDIQEGYDNICGGNGFGSFFACLAFLTAAGFAYLAHGESGSFTKLWLGWAVYFFCILIAYTSAFGSYASGYQHIHDAVGGDFFKSLYEGFGAAASFCLFAALVSAAGSFVTYKGQNTFKYAAFFATWCLFFLGYACYLGGYANGYCEINNPTSADEDHCNGYGVGTFFDIVAFILCVISVIVVLAQKGKDTDSDSGDNQSPPPATTTNPEGVQV